MTVQAVVFEGEFAGDDGSQVTTLSTAAKPTGSTKCGDMPKSASKAARRLPKAEPMSGGCDDADQVDADPKPRKVVRRILCESDSRSRRSGMTTSSKGKDATQITRVRITEI